MGTEVPPVLYGRLPVFTHVAPNTVAGGNNTPVPLLLSIWLMLSHHLQSLCGSAVLCTEVMAQNISVLLPSLLLQILTPALAAGLCRAKEKVLPTAAGLQLTRRDLAAVLPSPLV